MPSPAPAEIIARLEDAGRTLLALPDGGHSTRLRSTVWEVLREPMEAPAAATRLRPPVPDGPLVSRMDEALGWIALIPHDRYVLRRIVGARALVHPLTLRHMFPWRRLGTALGADHKAVQRWHAQGIAIIAAGLSGKDWVRPGNGRQVGLHATGGGGVGAAATK